MLMKETLNAIMLLKIIALRLSIMALPSYHIYTRPHCNINVQAAITDLYYSPAPKGNFLQLLC